MGYEVPDIGPSGPIISLGVRRELGYPSAGFRPISCNGLVDTGASSTAIAPAAAKPAGLVWTGVATVARQGGTVLVPTYGARVRLGGVGPAGWRELVLLRTAPSNSGVEMLLGRDILAWVSMLYVGSKGHAAILY